MPPVGFEPTISAGKQPQTHVLDRAATGTSLTLLPVHNIKRDLNTLFYLFISGLGALYEV